MKPALVIVSDANGKTFKALELDNEDGHIKAAVFVTDPDNGFGWPVGCQISDWLKPLGDGTYGS